MVLSLWRYAHLVLSVLTSVFLVIASVTGVILGVDGISEKYPSFYNPEIENISVSDFLKNTQGKYLEISEVSIDHNGYVALQGLDINGDDANGYVDVQSGEIIGQVPKKSAFMQWILTLHRSLFLHDVGRTFMGCISFCLFLIAFTGVILVVQRQTSFRKFFSKIVKDKWASFYHIVLGRWLLLPIIILSLTGSFLVVLHFFKREIPPHSIDFQEDISQYEDVRWQDFPIFQKTPLSEVRSIAFPFSDEEDEYFVLKLADREIAISQFSGKILSEVFYPKSIVFDEIGQDLHTGRTNILWAVVLILASASILFFIYSGFAITFNRQFVRIKNLYKPKESEIILLYGSENGSTLHFANLVHKQLLQKRKKSFLTELNNYQTFPKAQHLIIFTSTYGVGEAPSNGKKILNLLEKYPQKSPISVSVVGFGSSHYPDFCEFAKVIDAQTRCQDWATSVLELYTIDQKSENQFVKWVQSWGEKTGICLCTEPSYYALKIPKLHKIKVLEKTKTDEEGMFSLVLQPSKAFHSGDLLAIYPQGKERFYSIARVKNTLQLVVKLHENGVGSGYLHQLQKGDFLQGKIIQNPHFQLPNKPVIFISNGTGIAPFLGMLQQTTKPCYLYAGFRRKTFLVEKFTENFNQQKYLKACKMAFSREGNHCYVTDLLKEDHLFIADFLQKGGVIMLCGSLSMYKDVEKLLEEIARENQKDVTFYKNNQQILSDCY